jgi:hypothetical protein
MICLLAPAHNLMLGLIKRLSKKESSTIKEKEFCIFSDDDDDGA